MTLEKVTKHQLGKRRGPGGSSEEVKENDKRGETRHELPMVHICERGKKKLGPFKKTRVIGNQENLKA